MNPGMSLTEKSEGLNDLCSVMGVSIDVVQRRCSLRAHAKTPARKLWWDYWRAKPLASVDPSGGTSGNG